MNYSSSEFSRTGNNQFASPIDRCTYGNPGPVPFPFRGTTSEKLLNHFFVDVDSCPTWNVTSSTNPCEFQCDPSIPRVGERKIVNVKLDQ